MFLTVLNQILCSTLLRFYKKCKKYFEIKYHKYFVHRMNPKKVFAPFFSLKNCFALKGKTSKKGGK